MLIYCVIDAVFFSTYCGLNKDDMTRGVKRRVSEDASVVEVRHKPKQDVRTRSLKEAVKFAKRNNLLGVICEASPLVRTMTMLFVGNKGLNTYPLLCRCVCPH